MMKATGYWEKLGHTPQINELVITHCKAGIPQQKPDLTDCCIYMFHIIKCLALKCPIDFSVKN